MSTPAAAATSSVRVLARGEGWGVSDVRCARGPGDRRFEERHADVAIAAVLSGTFQYRSSIGRAVLYPGALLLGAAGACFECGHEHGSGDHCLALHFAPALFDEIGATASGDPRFRLRRAMLPASSALLAPLLRVQARLRQGDDAGVEEAVLHYAATVVRAIADVAPAGTVISARDQRRISAVVRYIELHYRDAPDLAQLASLACMSKYHFLRTFRRTLGVTPRQYLIQQRLLHAARALQQRGDGIATIALDAGFGDLSTFNALFRQVFGLSPGAYRAGH